MTWRSLTIVVIVCCFVACTSPAPKRNNYQKPPAKKQKSVKIPPYYKVKKGDTLYSIAFRYGLNYKKIAKWNGIYAPYEIYPNDLIYFRPSQRIIATSKKKFVKKSTTATSKKSKRVAPVIHPISDKARVTKTPVRSSKKSTTVNKTQQKKTIKKVTNLSTSIPNEKWIWPTQGKVFRTFAAKDSSRKGIDIIGKIGQPILAARGGQVVYSGNGLIGYGELIIIKHDKVFLSAYAHNRKRLVAEGDTVVSGQRIAEMGTTGTDRPLLHFEVRRDGRPVDPKGYLPNK